MGIETASVQSGQGRQSISSQISAMGTKLSRALSVSREPRGSTETLVHDSESSFPSCCVSSVSFISLLLLRAVVE